MNVYRLRVVIAGISPLIWRRLEVAADTTVAGLRKLASPGDPDPGRTPNSAAGYPMR